MKKNLKFIFIRYIMLIIAFMYLIIVYSNDFFSGLRKSSLAWLIFAIYLIGVIFVWKLSGKRRTESKTDSDKEAEISKEVFWERNKWFMP